MGEGLQNPDLNLNQLYDQAGQAMPEFADFGQSFLHNLQEKYPDQFAGVEFQRAELKDLERIQDKVTGDYKGDHTKVVDMVRGRLLVETPEQIQIIRHEISDLQDSLGIVKVKDFYAEPLETHFRTLNTQVQLPNGHVAEFRIDQIDMAIAGDNSHHLYEEMQELDRKVQAENRPFTDTEAERWQHLMEEQRAIFHDPAQKNNLDSLLNENGKAVLEEHRNHRMAGMAETFGRLGKNGGVIAGVTFGTLSGAFTLAAGGSKAQAAEAVYESAVPYGETSLDAVRGDLEAMERSATIETASNIGAAGGALAGAAIGTTIMPGVGTAVGAMIGGLGGGLASGEITALVYDDFETIKNGAVHISNEAADALNVAVRETASLWNWLRGNDEPENDRLLARLPTEIDDSAPPELQHLVEIKRLLVQARAEGANPDKIDSIEEMFDRACDTYEESGALEMAVASLDQWERAEQMAQVLIDDIKNKTAKSTEQPVIQSKNDLVFGR
ncbi:MAG: hypothetical protein H6936_13195 [Burkholderiales bacterium]|nr:hypothetical protein [Burkholderiales bacterium]